MRQFVTLLLVLGTILPARVADTQAQIAVKGLVLDLDADKGVEVEDGDRVVKSLVDRQKEHDRCGLKTGSIILPRFRYRGRCSSGRRTDHGSPLR